MSSLYIQFSSQESADSLVVDSPGFEYVPGAALLDAIYGDDAIDGPDDLGLWSEVRVMPRQGHGAIDPIGLPTPSPMPMPWPVIIGYDGMHPSGAGAAMKAEAGRWIPVLEFTPPISAAEQAIAGEQALARYSDRCREYAEGGLRPLGSNLSAKRST